MRRADLCGMICHELMNWHWAGGLHEIDGPGIFSKVGCVYIRQGWVWKERGDTRLFAWMGVDIGHLEGSDRDDMYRQERKKEK